VSTAFHKNPCSDCCCSHCASLRSRQSSARWRSTMHSSPTTHNYTSRSRMTTQHQGYQNAFEQFNIGLISTACLRTQTKLKPLLSALEHGNGWETQSTQSTLAASAPVQRVMFEVWESRSTTYCRSTNMWTTSASHVISTPEGYATFVDTSRGRSKDYCLLNGKRTAGLL
jgi:hypothetical protein